MGAIRRSIRLALVGAAALGLGPRPCACARDRRRARPISDLPASASASAPPHPPPPPPPPRCSNSRKRARPPPPPASGVGAGGGGGGGPAGFGAGGRRLYPSAAEIARGRRRGGGSAPPPSSPSPPPSRVTPPSMYWAVLHNWLYYLSLGFNAMNVPFLVRTIVDGGVLDGGPSPDAIALSGRVEAVDRLLTFAGVGFLSALSDRYGRRPLMAWSALGFMVTNLIQARASSSVAALYAADFVDGCSSCMLPLCQAYVTDCSPPSRRAANLGIFQGLSAGCAFILAFPIGGLLGARLGPRVPLLMAAAIQLLNALIIILVTPESNPTLGTPVDLRESNPIGGLVRLFGHGPLLRTASASLLLARLAQNSLDAQFVNYANLRFGWTQAQSGPVLVLVGLMLAVAPRLIVPALGLRRSILSGLLVASAGLAGAGLSPTSSGFVWSTFVVSVGCVCFPALQALLANLAGPGERGALLGAVGSLGEITAAVGSAMYASVLGLFTSDGAPLPIPGMHFLVGAGLLVVAWGIALGGFVANGDHPALNVKDVELAEADSL